MQICIYKYISKAHIFYIYMRQEKRIKKKKKKKKNIKHSSLIPDVPEEN